tara:strand:- start:4771 stop:5295 length:525 start_codon:yes stop_codon:yes gene_type:complete
MNSKKDLLVITASNGENLKLAQMFLDSSKKLKASAELLDLTCIDLPLFNPRKNKNTEVNHILKSLTKQMKSTPRWIICAPEYNGSIPPVLTNTIAWLSVQDNDFRQLFNGRPIAMASFSGGGCMELLISMRIQLTHLGAQVVGRQLSSNKQKPVNNESIDDLIIRLMQMHPLNL